MCVTTSLHASFWLKERGVSEPPVPQEASDLVVVIFLVFCNMSVYVFFHAAQTQAAVNHWGLNMLCRDMGTPLNVLRAGGISILDAAE